MNNLYQMYEQLFDTINELEKRLKKNFDLLQKQIDTIKNQQNTSTTTSATNSNNFNQN